jgi:hypothetical protein
MSTAWVGMPETVLGFDVSRTCTQAPTGTGT